MISYKDITHSPTIMIYYIYLMALYATYTSMEPMLSLVVTDYYGLGTNAVIVAFVVYPVAFLMSSIVYSKFSKKIEKFTFTKSMAYSCYAMAFCLLLCGPS